MLSSGTEGENCAKLVKNNDEVFETTDSDRASCCETSNACHTLFELLESAMKESGNVHAIALSPGRAYGNRKRANPPNEIQGDLGCVPSASRVAHRGVGQSEKSARRAKHRAVRRQNDAHR
jgi:hypothetical protein